MTRLFVARLAGAEEVPPVRTIATGVAVLRISRDQQRIHYRLTVNQLRKFIEAHIHLGARGVNGPIVAFLFGPARPGISVNRGIVKGTITKQDLVGPLQGRPLSDLIREIRAGNAYVNAHTKRHPGGEIRGQLRRVLTK